MSTAQLTPLLLRVEEAAKILGLSPHYIRKLADRGDLPKVKLGSRTLFDPADLRAFVEKAKRKKE